jgi:hypothetical protein
MSFLPLTMTSTIGAKHAGMASNHPEFVTHIDRLDARRDLEPGVTVAGIWIQVDVKADFFERAWFPSSIGGWRFLHNTRSFPLQELTRMFENVSQFKLQLE